MLKIKITVLYRVNPLHYKMYKSLFNILWYSRKRVGFSTDFSRFFPLSINTFHQTCPFFNMVKNVSTFQLFINRPMVKIQSLSQTAFEWLFNTSDTPYCYCCLIIIILYDFLFAAAKNFLTKKNISDLPLTAY